MSLVFSAFVPHPPLLIPEIGRGQEHVCQKTLNAYRSIAARLVFADPEIVVLVSPHAPLLRDGITILMDNLVGGNFAAFGVPKVTITFPNDPDLIKTFQEELPNARLRQGELDHGALLPLYFFERAGWKGRVVLVGMPLDEPEKYGQMIGEILRQQEQRCALIASGDLSHRLKEDGPYGFHPAGPKFDQAIIEGLKGDLRRIINISDDVTEDAGECGYRSLRLALAAHEGAPEVLSYEGPFGVGYLVAELYHSSSLAHWARRCLTEYVSTGTVESLSLPTEPEFLVRRGCFVTLKKNGELRGCIGTTQAWQDNLALEIRHNAIAAGTEDPRFWPVEEKELPMIRFSVDVLGDLEKIDRIEKLDPWRYGVVVRSRGRTGLLLPHLEGVDTVEQQVGIAKQKADLGLSEPVEMWRFEVLRHYE